MQASFCREVIFFGRFDKNSSVVLFARQKLDDIEYSYYEQVTGSKHKTMVVQHDIPQTQKVLRITGRAVLPCLSYKIRSMLERDTDEHSNSEKKNKMKLSL